MTKRDSGHEANLETLVVIAKSIAHPTRLRVLGMLAGGELCVCQMTALLELAPSTVSQHLSVLARGGLIASRKEGKLVFYRLSEGGSASKLVDVLLEMLDGDATLGDDQAVVERLRRVSIEELCAAELDLAEIGVREALPTVSAEIPADHSEVDPS